MIHHYINYLVDVGLFPKEAAVGRLSVGRFTRTGLAVEMHYLHQWKEKIMDTLEDKYDVDPEEVFRIMEQGVVIAAYHRMVTVSCTAVDGFMRIVSHCPKSVQSLLLGRPEHMNTVRQRMLDQSTNV